MHSARQSINLLTCVTGRTPSQEHDIAVIFLDTVKEPFHEASANEFDALKYCIYLNSI